jgi:hypothetical protein
LSFSVISPNSPLCSSSNNSVIRSSCIKHA